MKTFNQILQTIFLGGIIPTEDRDFIQNKYRLIYHIQNTNQNHWEVWFWYREHKVTIGYDYLKIKGTNWILVINYFRKEATLLGDEETYYDLEMIDPQMFPILKDLETVLGETFWLTRKW